MNTVKTIRLSPAIMQKINEWATNTAPAPHRYLFLEEGNITVDIDAKMDDYWFRLEVLSVVIYEDEEERELCAEQYSEIEEQIEGVLDEMRAAV